MKIIPLLFLLLLFPLNLIAQKTRVIPDHEYKFSYEIDEALRNGKIRLHQAASNYSYIGEYQKALSVPNEIDLAWGFDTITKADMAHFNEFEAVSAIEEIIKLSKNERILILNEGHHKPVHRVFVRKLLKGLFDNGYRLFGLETLTNCSYAPPGLCDQDINERGYVLNSPMSGTYITEPQMSNLISEALAIGFEVFAYEKFGEGREMIQAKYISEKIEQNPKSKTLILCGGLHLLETENKGKKWMANYLKKYSNIDPFTIYQDILSERNCTEESALMQRLSFNEEKLFVNNEGEYFNGKRGFDKFDALIYHPRTSYKNNRPNWLTEFPGNILYSVKVKGKDYPYLIKAYSKERGFDSVPIDIIEKEYDGDETALVLPKGAYILEIVDRYRRTKRRGIVVK